MSEKENRSAACEEAAREAQYKNELLQWALVQVRQGVPGAQMPRSGPDLPGRRAPAAGGIGTLGERTLHAALKYCYEPDARFHEIPMQGFVADIARADGVTEIQTGSFYPLRKKLPALLEKGPVTVVHPLAAQKRVIWVDPETGELSAPRKSPRPDRPSDVLPELFWLLEWLHEPGLHIELPLLVIDEYKLKDGFGAEGKRHATRYERIPTGWLGSVTLWEPDDYTALLPPGLPAVFTAAEFAKAVRLRGRRASAAMKVLSGHGIIARTGERRGRAYVYAIGGNAAAEKEIGSECAAGALFEGKGGNDHG